MHKHSLRKGSKKDICPQCNRRTFKPYVDNSTGQIISAEVGKCDRIHKCCYHYTPKEHFARHGITFDKETWQKERWNNYTPPAKRAPFPTQYLKTNYDCTKNNLYTFLCQYYDAEAVQNAFNLYQCQSYRFEPSVLVVPYINHYNDVRAVQLMQYNADGHRNKEARHHWYHSSLIAWAKEQGKETPADLAAYNSNANKLDCFFGAHLLPVYQYTKIYLVEAAKTAIICTLEHGTPAVSGKLFLATYSKQALYEGNLLPMRGRSVSIIADNDAFADWHSKMQSQHVCNYFANDIAFDYINEKSDIADWYIMQRQKQSGGTSAAKIQTPTPAPPTNTSTTDHRTDGTPPAEITPLATNTPPPTAHVQTSALTPRIYHLTIDDYLNTYEQVPCWYIIDSPFADGCNGGHLCDDGICRCNHNVMQNQF